MKYSRFLPASINSLFQSLNLTQITFSKYVDGILAKKFAAFYGKNVLKKILKKSFEKFGYKLLNLENDEFSQLTKMINL